MTAFEALFAGTTVGAAGVVDFLNVRTFLPAGLTKGGVLTLPENQNQ